MKYRMKWHTGRISSRPDKGAGYLTRLDDGKWYVYKTDTDGMLLEGFPKLREAGFDHLEDAQHWIEDSNYMGE